MAASELSQKPLIAYSPSHTRLYAPLGAELPGLYERAITLETGKLGSARKNFVVYDDVPADLAGRIAFLLSS
jgi:hypothetical protein